MPAGAKKKRKAAAKKKKGTSQDKPSLDTHVVEDASTTSLPSPGSAKEGSDSGSDIASPRNPEAPEVGVSESKEEGKEDFLSGESAVLAMDTFENGAKVVEAEEVPVVPVQEEEVGGPIAEEPKVVESDSTPPESAIQVPVFYDGGAHVELVEATDTEVPVIHDGGVTIEHVEAPHEEGPIPGDDSAQPIVEPQEEVAETPMEVPVDEKFTTPEPVEASRDVSVDDTKLDTTPEPAEASREVSLDEYKLETTPEPAEAPREVAPDQKLHTTTPEPAEVSREVQLDLPSDAAIPAVVEPPESPVPLSQEPVVPGPGYVEPESVVVEKVEPSTSVEPASEVKASVPITSVAYSEQPQANTETRVHTQESRGVGAEAFLPPQSAPRASWWNCCGLCDVFAGNR